MLKVYAFYVGDEFMATGTINEITKSLGYHKTSIYALRTPTRLKNRPDTSSELIELGYLRFKKEYLNELVKDTGLPVYKVAEKIGISSSGLHYLMKGQSTKPNAKTIKGIIDYFEVEEHELYEFIEKEMD